MTPFRSEKNTNWEGAFRVPLLVRWPGKVEAGSVSPTGSCSTTTGCRPSSPWPATPDVVEKLKKGYQGQRQELTRTTSTATTCCRTSPARRRRARATSSSTSATTATCSAIRYDNWKLVFMEQRLPGHDAGLGRAVRRGCACRRYSTCGPIPTSAPTSPRTRTTTGVVHNAYFIYAAQAAAAKFVETFKEFPPVQKPGSFTIDDAMAKMGEVAGSS